MEALFHKEYPVAAGDFSTAGSASGDIKRSLKKLGIPAEILRRISVAAYEVELNLVIHSMGGVLTLEMTESDILLISADVGPGIADVSLAMQEGWSTASEEARNMGFGAGMGLPNMRRNADGFDIQSTLGVGTTITMSFHIA